MAISKPISGVTGLQESKMMLAVEMFRHNHRDIKIVWRDSFNGDYLEFFFEGIGNHIKIDKAFLVKAEPTQIYKLLEDAIKYRPDKKPAPMKKPITGAGAWAEDWSKRNG